MSHRAFLLILTISLFVSPALTQSAKAPDTNQKHTIRIGVALPTNRSSHQIIPTWERDQLVRELKRLQSDRKSTIVLEAVSLESSDREDAATEAEKKDCQFFVLTTLLNPTNGPGISGGPDGTQRSPVLLGNTNPNKTLAMNFTLLEVGTARTIAEGTTTAPIEGNNDIRAADETMRFVAHRVATEPRTQHPPTIN